MHAQYYEGILQLRNPTKEILTFIDEMLEKKNVLITKQKKMKNGFDLYVTDQHVLQQLGKKLKQKFGGELKVSSSLFTRNRMTGKEVHRVNVLFRHYDLKAGDELTYRGDKVKVQKLGDEKVTVKNLKTGKNMFLNYEDFD